MMVGTYRQHLACVAAQLNGVKRHRSMKPSSRDPQLGLASPLNYAANKSGKIKIKSPSQKEAGAGCKSPALASREGTGETFFLDILFHRMSEMRIFHQLPPHVGNSEVKPSSEQTERATGLPAQVVLAAPSARLRQRDRCLPLAYIPPAAFSRSLLGSGRHPNRSFPQ